MPLPFTPPSSLRRSGKVAVLAISSPSKPDRIERARRNLQAAGLEVVLADNLYESGRSYLAGDDRRRAGEINRFLNDPSIDAFFFSRGGYGAMRILEHIDFEAIARNPRPIIGYSDLTALHQAVSLRCGIITFHGPMLNSDFHDGLSPAHDAWFWRLMEGAGPVEHGFEDVQIVSGGRAEGILFGGCLSLTTSLLGTPYDFWIDDGIWFWEDVDEPTYRIDRMLTQLRLSGRLQRIRGVMIGKLKECGGRDAGELDALLTETFADSGVPVVRELPFGHHGDNLLMPIGCPAVLDADRRTLSLPHPVTSGISVATAGRP